MASDSSLCPGVNSASKNECRDTPGFKGTRCVRLTTYHLHVPNVKKSGGLNFLEPCGPVQACNGTDFYLMGKNNHQLATLIGSMSENVSW